MTLSEIESRLVAACLELRPQYPAAFEGYYDRLLSEGRILTDADRVIVEWVCNEFERDACIIEICAGLGQLSHALALAGFSDVQAIENDPNRHYRMMDIGVATGSRAKTLQGRFQHAVLACDLLICTNAVSQLVQSQDVQFLFSAVAGGANLVWQPQLFGVDGTRLLDCRADAFLEHGIWHQWK